VAGTVTEMQHPRGPSPLMRGILQAMPVVMGYIPIGFAFGVQAGQGHLSLTATLLMSLIVYAGSAQLIAAAMFASGQPMLSIVLTTFIVNLRHLLMSAAIAPYLSRWPKLSRFLFATELTDETFAIHSLQFATLVPQQQQVFAANLTSHLSWITGSVLGYAAGSLLSDVKPYGLDYALSAMFIALLLLQIKHSKMVCVALVAGLISVVLTIVGISTWSVIIASVLGATVGVVLETWTKKASF
jgi:4-azaleucine resistance transporter AzlC